MNMEHPHSPNIEFPRLLAYLKAWTQRSLLVMFVSKAQTVPQNRVAVRGQPHKHWVRLCSGPVGLASRASYGRSVFANAPGSGCSAITRLTSGGVRKTPTPSDPAPWRASGVGIGSSDLQM